jgi:hypothetical protein
MKIMTDQFRIWPVNYTDRSLETLVSWSLERTQNLFWFAVLFSLALKAEDKEGTFLWASGVFSRTN